MKVIYPGPLKTYHPQLGKLVAGQSFEMDNETAEKYIESGLLKEVKSKTKNAGFTAEKAKEKGNGKSINRKRSANRPEKSDNLAHSSSGRSE